MTELTAAQAELAAENLELAAQVALGRMLFEYSRLDLALSLLIVWSDEGKNIAGMTEKIERYTFIEKLSFLTELLNKLPVERLSTKTAYANWLRDAHRNRMIRNQLVHGRWGIDPYSAQVLNVVGLPTSTKQREIRYSIKRLTDSVEDIRKLQERLQDLRTHSPV